MLATAFGIAHSVTLVEPNGFAIWDHIPIQAIDPQGLATGRDDRHLEYNGLHNAPGLDRSDKFGRDFEVTNLITGEILKLKGGSSIDKLIPTTELTAEESKLLKAYAGLDKVRQKLEKYNDPDGEYHVDGYKPKKRERKIAKVNKGIEAWDSAIREKLTRIPKPLRFNDPERSTRRLLDLS